MKPSALTRRGFLAAAGGALLLPSAALAAVAESVPKDKRRMLQVNGYAIDAETPLDALTTYITPNDLFFVRHHWNPMYPDVRRWTLTVDGEVSSPQELTVADLKKLPRAEATCVLQCAGNGRGLYRPPVPGVQWKAGAIGNARWTGVRVRDVLERAGVKSTAKHLHTFGSDKPPEKVPPFHRSLEIEKALADGILAWEMNGQPLPALHGAPVRLVVPGWAGDHWMKWLVRLSPQPEAQTGFYMDTAYRYPKTPGEPGAPVPPENMQPVTELFVKSSITDAPPAAKVGAPVTIRGFAFSGAPGHREGRGHRRRGDLLARRGARSASRPVRLAALVVSMGAARRGTRDAPRAGDRQPRVGAAEGSGLEPERLPPQRVAGGRDRGGGVRRWRRLAAAALVAALGIAAAGPMLAKAPRKKAKTKAPAAADFDVKLPVLGTSLQEYPAGSGKGGRRRGLPAVSLGEHGAPAAAHREAVDGIRREDDALGRRRARPTRRPS